MAGLMLVLLGHLMLTPALAQGNTKFTTSPVILDGRPIFQVSSSGQFTAKERGDLINTQLRDAVTSPDPLNVRVEMRNQLPTILLNDRYLLTVTELDAPAGLTPQEQANKWAAQIQQVVNLAQKERSKTYIRNTLLESMAVLMIVFALHALCGWFWQNTLRRSLQRLLPFPDPATPNPPQSFDLFLGLTLFSTRAGLWFAALLYIVNLFPLTRRWSYQILGTFTSTFTAPLITLGEKSYSVIGLLILGILLWGLFLMAGSATKVLQARILQVAGINRSTQEMIAIVTKYSLIILGTIVLLQIWGLDLSSLTILASALGVGIGFGFQDIAKNFGSGLVLILERPIQIGDFIEVGEYKGIVERIGGRSTLIKTLDQVSIIVPNSCFLEKELINWNHDNFFAGVRLPLGVAYNSNVEDVRKALLESAASHPDVLTSPNPQVLFKGFGDSALNFELRVWTSQPSKQFILKSDLYYRIEENLRKHNIEIPFPQRDLNLRTGHLQVQVTPQLETLLLQLLENQLNNGQVKSNQPAHQERDGSISHHSES